MKFKRDLQRYISNLPGYRTPRKIVVIESDDWGSVYMSTQEAFNKLSAMGFDFSKSHYLNFDCLESNADLEMLFEVLSKHKDSTGRTPVMTGVNVIANPNFEKIKANGFSKYEYELFPETCKRYKACDHVYELWKEGISKRLFVPIFHGREHLNVQRWMKLLQEDNQTIKTLFEYEIPCVSKGINGAQMPDLRAAFDIDKKEDIEYLKEVISTGLNDFEKLYGYRAKYFIPTNGPFNNSLETTLNDCGIKYIGTGKVQLEPLGNQEYKKHFRYMGKKNSFGQVFLTRNCFFEPSSWEHSRDKDWVNDCLKEIEIAFRCFKPATISSHRVNYTGSLHPENRANGLKKLDLLLSEIIKKWPMVEFMTSEELGDLIAKS
ncbi:MAG: hypothetical protein EZS26_001275 [Candidatus Ordinivivax streblomastigis]|uniref:Polysaccharide (De)acetylase n=1 Tax=Candidatus Ordinivivax streblomastigis TaxID=2540710 RepID=A0A5M8P1X9_9BACT|nr:MAG: hypothetical protein EZS26_001275 [Candidatus Ordinivivax streblomastigis]